MTIWSIAKWNPPSDNFEQLRSVYEFITHVRTLYEKQVGFKSIRQYYSARPADYVVRSLIPLTNLPDEEKDMWKIYPR